MHLLDATTADAYLREHGHLESHERGRITQLAGGVSNEVLLVEREGGDRFVLKQAREQLKTKQEWRCSIERIFREVEVLKICSGIAGNYVAAPDEQVVATVPELLFEDRDHFCYAMTAAPAEHSTWKQQLLEGRTEVAVAGAAGQLLGRLHADTWHHADLAASLDDQTFFKALRIDPYYRRIAEVHPEVQAEIDLLIDSVTRHRSCLVHGDFSPKNLLVYGDQLMLIDFEVGHYGDPAFDNGFCLTHLVLKAIWSGARRSDYMHVAEAYWTAYQRVVKPKIGNRDWLALEERSVFNLAGCLLARVDGKSPVDYLDSPQQQSVRELALRLLRSPPSTVAETLKNIE